MPKQITHICEVCGTVFKGRRDARTCSPACRKRRQRERSLKSRLAEEAKKLEQSAEREFQEVSRTLFPQPLALEPVDVTEDDIPLEPVQTDGPQSIAIDDRGVEQQIAVQSGLPITSDSWPPQAAKPSLAGHNIVTSDDRQADGGDKVSRSLFDSFAFVITVLVLVLGLGLFANFLLGRTNQTGLNQLNTSQGRQAKIQLKQQQALNSRTGNLEVKVNQLAAQIANLPVASAPGPTTVNYVAVGQGSGSSSSATSGGSNANIDASQITSGTLSDARLSGNVALLNGINHFQPTGNNAAAFSLQNAGGTLTLVNFDTTGGGLVSFGVPVSFGSTVTVGALGATGSQPLCLNGSNQIADCTGGGGGSGVTSLNAMIGDLTIANTTSNSGTGTITINDASTGQKGIAQFNNTEFNVSGGNVSFNTGATPTFAGLTLSNLNTIGIVTNSAGGVLGTTQTLPSVVQGNITTVGALGAGSIGGSFGNINIGGNIFTGSGSGLTNLPASQISGQINNNNLTNNGALTVTAGTGLSGGGSVALGGSTTLGVNFGSSLGQVAQGSNTVTCPSVTGTNLAGGGGSFAVGAGGNCNSIGFSTTPGFTSETLGIAGPGGTSGSIVFQGSGNTNTLTLQGPASPAAGNFTLSLPAITGADTVCTVNTCTGAGSGSGNTNYIFNQTTQQASSNFNISGTGTIGNGLTISNGGANITGTVTLAGLSAGGVVQAAAGTGVLGIGKVTLGSQTNGDYVANIGTLTGLTVSGNSGAGSTPGLSVNYGDVTGTAVQGNVTLTCPSGTGNLTGTGNTITLGDGGTCNSIGISPTPSFTSVTTTGGIIVQGNAGLTIGVAGTTPGNLVLATGGSGLVTLSSANQANTLALSVPADTNTTDTICLQLKGNCSFSGTAAGGDLNGNYPNPGIAKLQGTTLTLSSLSNGDVLQYSSGSTAIINGKVTDSNLASGIFTHITGVGALTAGSIGTGFGTISTGNNITTTATVQGGVVNATTGFQLAGAATSGNFLRGNGTNFVSGAIQSSDINGLALFTLQGTSGSSQNVAAGGTVTIAAGTNITTVGTATNTVTVNVSLTPTFTSVTTTGNVNVQGGGLTLGVAGTSPASLILASGGSGSVTLSSANQANAVALSIPADTNLTDTICLQTKANCTFSGTAAGGDLTGSYPNPTIASLQATTLTISSINSGDVLQYNGSAIINGKITDTNLASGTFTHITGVGTLGAGSIGTGFGTISTNNSIATSTTLQGATINATTGFQISGAAASGNYLRGNGTNFVSSALQAGDISGTLFTLQGSTGSNQTVTAGSTVQILAGSSNNLTAVASATNKLTVDIINNPTFSGLVTASNTGSTALAITGAPTNSATSSLVQIGSPIASGNNNTNGGTYLGLNEPLSGAGSAADFLNFQVNGVFKLKVTNTGSLVAQGAITSGGTISATGTGTATAFQAVKPAANPVLQNNLVSGDANPSFQILGSGQIGWGLGGTNPLDTNLYRSAAATLKTDGAFVTGTTLTVGSIGAAANATYLCSNGGLISNCASGSTGSAFVQGGNSFGTQALLGTSDNNGLGFITNGGTAKLVLDTSGNLTFQQASTISSNSTNSITLDSGSTGGVNIATGANAKAIAIGNSQTGTTLASTAGGTVTTQNNSGVVVKTNTNSTTAFQVQNAAATALLNADTTNTKITVTGQLSVAGGFNTAGLSTPTLVSVTPIGGTNLTQWKYTVSAVNANGGSTVPPTAIGTSLGVVTLSGSQFNRIVWSGVTGASSYNIYRTLAGGTPSTTGLIGTVLASTGTLQFDDTGLAASGTTPSVDNSGQIVATGTALFENAVNSQTAFQIQNQAGTNILVADTTDSRIGIGTGATVPGNLLSVNNLSAAVSGAQLAVGTGSAGNVGLVIQGVNSQSGDLFDGQTYNGSVATTVFSVGANGNLTVKGSGNGSTVAGSGALFQNSANSTNAFEIQNQAGTSNLFVADTTNTHIGIGMVPLAAGATLQVAGAISATGSLSIGGNTICTSGGCTVATASNNFIQNSISNVAAQTANFWIQSNANTPNIIQAGATGTADILQILNSSGTKVDSFDSNGNLTLINTSSTAFQIQNSGATPLLIADTTNSNGITGSGMTLTIEGTSSNFTELTFSNIHIKDTQTTAPANPSSLVNCGTGATATTTAGSTDTAGSFTINSGTSIGAGTQCAGIVVFNKAYPVIPKAVLITPGNGNASSLGVGVSQVNVNNFAFITGGKAATNTTYVYYYWVIE